MKLTIKKILVSTLLWALPILSFSQYQIPEGWRNAGSALVSYNFGVDQEIKSEGIQSAYIESIDQEIDGFATLMQSCDATPFKGKKIKLTAYAKSENIGGWAGFWLRIDGEEKEGNLGFDNMADRPIEGTNEWTKYEIILDVPENSVRLAYGILLFGTGKIWFDDLSFQELSDTGSVEAETRITDGPTNIGFEK